MKYGTGYILLGVGIEPSATARNSLPISQNNVRHSDLY